MSKNYYETLDISKTATQDDIKEAYKKLAKKWHPDKNLENKKVAEEKFKEVAEVYSVLSDPEKRKMYDQFGKTDFNEPEMGHGFRGGMPGGVRFSFGGNMGGNFADHIFRDFFGGENIRLKCSPTMCQLGCSLEDLYTGTTKKIKMTQEGKEEMININVLQGWKDGTKITFENKGRCEEDKQQGDLIFNIKELPHKLFKRDKNDLITTFEITTMKDGKHGFSRNIKFLDGTDLNVEIPPLKRSDYRHCVKGKGMPIRMNGSVAGFGDLFINFVVIF